jgi:hypothetical protein
LGDTAELRRYMDDEPPSLAMHFRILDVFDAR